MRRAQASCQVPSLHIYECWIGGGKIKRVRRKIEDEMSRISRFEPQICLVHLGHNNIAKHATKNPDPIWPKKSIDALWDLGLMLKQNFATSQVILSAPWPRIPSRHYDLEYVTRYNGIADHMLSYMRSKSRKSIASSNIDIKVLSTPELWISARQKIGDDQYYDSYDGLHLNEVGKAMIARKWLQAAQSPEDITLPPCPLVKKPPKRKLDRKRGGRKHQK